MSILLQTKAKEKAKSIFNKMKLVKGFDNIPQQKKCALVAVDEIILNIDEWDCDNDNAAYHKHFWNLVKIEIENIS